MIDFRDTKFISYEYGNRPYYLLPYSIINQDNLKPNGDVLYDGKYYKIKEGIYIYSRAFTSVIRKLTNINEEIYYRKYIANIPDDYVVRCRYCGKPKSFVSISKGYSGGIGNGYIFDPNSLYCNSSCLLNHKYEEDGFKTFITDKLNSIESQAKGRFTQWINLGNPDDSCYFYLAVVGDHYKFGISNKSNRSTWYNEFITFHKIISGTRLQVGRLERDLKIHLNTTNEYFNKSEFIKIKEFIRNYNY